jgi:hypothetical protein
LTSYGIICYYNPITTERKIMNIDKGTQFVISYIPETINGEKNTDIKTIRRSALFDDKSKVWTTTKGETVLTYFDLERNGYRTAKNFIITLKG